MCTPRSLYGRQEKNALSYKRTRELAVEYVIYSDGSIAEGTLEGGAGVVDNLVTQLSQPTVVD